MSYWIQSKFSNVISSQLVGLTTTPVAISGGMGINPLLGVQPALSRQAISVSNTSTSAYIYIGFSTAIGNSYGNPVVNSGSFDICVQPLQTELISANGEVIILVASSVGVVSSKISEIG